jgi:hypothetical protein
MFRRFGKERNTMKWLKLRLIIFTIVAVAVLWIVYAQRIHIEAWAWHRRHGTSITVGSYVVPVPSNWYVESLDNGSQMLVRLDTDDNSSTKRVKAHAGILLLLGRPLTTRDLDLLRSIDIASSRKQGSEPVQRALTVDGEMFSCLNTKLDSTGTYDVEPVHWNCKSLGGLQMIVGSTEPDMKQVWEIVSGVRKKS